MRTFNGYHFAGIIPARYASSRFPGKPLVTIGGKPMIQRVYEQASKSLDIVYIATDDPRIFDGTDFGGKGYDLGRTSERNRLQPSYNILIKEGEIKADVVVNIQGDEPFIRPEQVDRLVSCFADKSVEIATLVRKVEPGEDITNPNHPKVILDLSGNAIYFSRSVIPFIRDAEMSEWTLLHPYYKHIGLYAYKTEILNRITLLPRSSLEKTESLEQNRWLENGYRIRTTITEWESICIDTPGDLDKARKFFNQLK
jgi:3-deoxy-manno-octulosonate cytidylyltransferase (CMP-KDO synthetase)